MPTVRMFNREPPSRTPASKAAPSSEVGFQAPYLSVDLVEMTTIGANNLLASEHSSLSNSTFEIHQKLPQGGGGG